MLSWGCFEATAKQVGNRVAPSEQQSAQTMKQGTDTATASLPVTHRHPRSSIRSHRVGLVDGAVRACHLQVVVVVGVVSHHVAVVRQPELRELGHTLVSCLDRRPLDPNLSLGLSLALHKGLGADLLAEDLGTDKVLPVQA